MSDEIKEVDGQEQAEEKMLSQTEVNAIIARTKEKTRTGATGEILKELGFEDLDSLKATFTELKSIKESKMSEDEKTKAENENMKKLVEKLENENKTASLKIDMIANGVDPAKVTKAIKLYDDYDGDTIQDKIKSMIEDIPSMAGKKQAADFGAGKQDTGSKESDLEAMIGKALGLK